MSRHREAANRRFSNLLIWAVALSAALFLFSEFRSGPSDFTVAMVALFAGVAWLIYKTAKLD